MGFFDKILKGGKGKEHKEDLNEGLKKTRTGFFSKLGKSLVGKSTVDDEILDQLEEALITADVSLDTTVSLIENIEKRVSKDKYLNTKELAQILKEEMLDLLKDSNNDNLEDFHIPQNGRPTVVLVVGVNGVGKTTTIGKLAYHYKQAGYNVMLGAADTFRAAAVEQLTVWAERLGVDIVKKEMGSDPASVAFDAANSAVAKNKDLLIIDTAGRLHNKAHLMDELAKIKRAISKVIPDAPDEVLLVLDGSTGQNALQQAKQFAETTDVSALAITKLDGTAKGGIVLSIAHQMHIPIRYVGVGEQANHLQIFDKDEFVDSLFKLEEVES